MRPDIDAGPIGRKCKVSKGPGRRRGIGNCCLLRTSGQERLRGDGDDSNGEEDQT